MSRVIEIRKLINTTLRAVHPRVYYQSAPETATYPYLVYDLPDSIDDRPIEQFNLEVDGWDKPGNGDTTALETMMESVDRALHRKQGIFSELGVTIFRARRLSPTDDDPQIKRRKHAYDLRVIGGR